MNRSEAAELGAFYLSVNLTSQMSKELVEGGLVQEEKKKPAHCLALVRLRNSSWVREVIVQEKRHVGEALPRSLPSWLGTCLRLA